MVFTDFIVPQVLYCRPGCLSNCGERIVVLPHRAGILQNYKMLIARQMIFSKKIIDLRASIGTRNLKV
jgi:hypothetical protein